MKRAFVAIHLEAAVKLLAGIGSIVFMVGAAHATLIEQDYATSGDGLLILDTTTNRQWVDVTHTTNMSVNNFFNSSIYASGGFHLGTTADITAFFLDAGAAAVNPNSYNPITGSYNAALLLNTLMEHAAPYSDTGGNPWVHGYENYGSGTNLTIARFIALDTTTATFDTGTNGNYWTYDTANAAVGIFAWRDAPATVPEPASLALLGLGLAGLGFSRRSKS